MAITSVQYGNADKSSFVVVDDGITMFVPDDKLNRERQMIDVWLETEGNVIEPFPTPAPVIPQSVSNYQARTLLIQQGLFAQVDKALRGADQTVTANQIALTAWDYANDYYRQSAFVEAMGKVLNLTDAQIDEMFVTASQIV